MVLAYLDAFEVIDERAAVLESEAGMASDVALDAAIEWWIDKQSAQP